MNIEKLVKKYYVFKTLKVNDYTIKCVEDYDYLISNIKKQIKGYIISGGTLNLYTY